MLRRHVAGPGRASRAGAVVAVLLGVGASALAGMVGMAGMVATAPEAVAATATPSAVQVTVLSVDPPAPTAGTTAQKITVTLRLTNTTAHDYSRVQVVGVRGNPVDNQKALDAVISTVQTPDPGLAADIATAHPVTTALGPYGSATLTYRSTTSTSVDAGLCLCQNRIYPLYFGVYARPAGSAGTTGTLLGAGQTFVASFGQSTPQPVQVSWVWPILERPHRSTSEDVFTDDDLAESVAAGRLDDLLRTLEIVVSQHPTTPLTVLTDPDLIDELAVMATGDYQVATGDAATETKADIPTSTPTKGASSSASATPTTPTTRPGLGADAARAWLTRLRDVLDTDPDLQLAFTPYADPEVRSLVAAGLSWTQALPAAERARVTSALGGRTPDTDLAWPTGESLDTATLTALAGRGIDTVVVNDRTVPGNTRGTSRPDALASVKTKAGTSVLAVTSSTLEKFAQRAIAESTGTTAVPQLLAELAVRAVVAPKRSHFVVLTPQRNADPDPQAASRAILATTTAPWTQALTLDRARELVRPTAQGAIHEQPLKTGLPQATIDAVQYLSGIRPTLTSLLTDPTHKSTPVVPPAPATGTGSSTPTPGPSGAVGTSDGSAPSTGGSSPPYANATSDDSATSSGTATGPPATPATGTAATGASGAATLPPATLPPSTPATSGATSPSPSPSPSSTVHLTPTERGEIEAATLLAGLPLAIQRSESTEWDSAGTSAPAYATALRTRIEAIIAGVHLIRPTQGTYTLGSADAPLPISIDNTLDMPVWVRLSVGTVGGLPGLSAGDVGVKEVLPLSRLPVHVPIDVARAGRFQVRVGLSTPAYQDLGTSLQLSVRSTALGRIGKLITYVAAAVLAAALLLRLLRRLYRRHRPGAAPATNGSAHAAGHIRPPDDA